MKRLVFSNDIDGYREYLRQFLGDDFTEQDLEDMVNDAFPSDREPEVLLTPELEKEIRSQFSRKDADEICNLIALGHSTDDAIQTVLGVI